MSDVSPTHVSADAKKPDFPGKFWGLMWELQGGGGPTGVLYTDSRTHRTYWCHLHWDYLNEEWIFVINVGNLSWGPGNKCSYTVRTHMGREIWMTGRWSHLNGVPFIDSLSGLNKGVPIGFRMLSELPLSNVFVKALKALMKNNKVRITH